MNDRHTSPALSRALAEAGLDCTPGPHWHTDHQGATGWALHVTDSLTCKGVRALDLTDILHELTRPRPEGADARPLCVTWEEAEAVKRCEVCKEGPVSADFCLRCEAQFVMALQMRDSFTAIARWAARRARRFERARQRRGK